MKSKGREPVPSEHTHTHTKITSISHHQLRHSHIYIDINLHKKDTNNIFPINMVLTLNKLYELHERITIDFIWEILRSYNI